MIIFKRVVIIFAFLYIVLFSPFFLKTVFADGRFGEVLTISKEGWDILSEKDDINVESTESTNVIDWQHPEGEKSSVSVESTKNNLFIPLIILAAILGGAFYFFKVKKS